MRASLRSAVRSLLLLAVVAGAPATARGADDEPSLVTASFALHLPASYAGDPLPLVREAVARQGGHLRLVESPRDPVPMPSLLAEVVDVSVSGPDEDLVRLSAGRTLRGSDPETLLASPRTLLLTAAAPRAAALRANRALCTLAAAVATRTRAVVYDTDTREYFSPGRWREWRAEDWKGQVPDVRGHVTVHQYPLGEGVRSITLGMSKFGLPDLVVTGHSRSSGGRVLDLLNLVAQTLLEGGAPGEDGRLPIALDALRHPHLRASLEGDLGPGAGARGVVRLSGAVRDAGDPENRLREVLPEGVGDGEDAVRLERLLTALFGAGQGEVVTRHGPATGALAQASERARRRLVEEVKPRFLAGLPLGDVLFVKGPFEIDEGRTEWMWVEVTGWEGGRIRGILANDSEFVQGLEAGARVEVEESSVFDYLLRHADGSEEGNETARILSK